MGNTTNMANWAAAERMRSVEAALWWRGWVQRGDLAEVFGISGAQASSDLQKYQELNPGVMMYHMRRKRYEAGSGMQMILQRPDLRDGIRLFLGSGEVGFLGGFGSSGGGEHSPVRDIRVGVAELPVRKAVSEVERDVIRALLGGKRIRMRYWSMNSAEVDWREVAPHALGFDGYRWHMRAWCYRNDGYRDFVLGRIEAGEVLDQAGEPGANDRDWQEVEELKYRINPTLSDKEQETLKMDFALDAEELLVVRSRRAMSLYVMKHIEQLGRDEEQGLKKVNYFERTLL